MNLAVNEVIECLDTFVPGALCAAEKSRRAAARVAHEEESQALSRSWRDLQRSLSGERGLWMDPDCLEPQHWKLDKFEDPSRRWDVLQLSTIRHALAPCTLSLDACPVWQLNCRFMNLRHGAPCMLRRLKLKRNYKFQMYSDPQKGPPAQPAPASEAALHPHLALPGVPDHPLTSAQ